MHSVEKPSPRHKILFSDLDRTFLTYGYAVLPKVVDAVEAAHTAGLAIVFVTARAPGSLLSVIGPLGMSGLAACFNGGWIGHLAQNKANAAKPLPKNIATQVFEDALVRGADPIWYGEAEILARTLTPTIMWQTAKIGEQAVAVPGFSTQTTGPYKLLVVDRRISNCFDSFREKWINTVSAVQSHPALLEITPLGVSKGAAVQRIMNLKGLDPSECAAVGDAENDFSMLKAVGTPCAVGNAIMPIKEIAHYVGASCENGGFADVVSWLIGQHATKTL